jgi:CHAT domain-containing protein/Tfp pilus assembly protein PilF
LRKKRGHHIFRTLSMKDGLTSQILLIVLLTVLLPARLTTYAAPPRQDSSSALRILNDSEQTICFVLIASVTDATWVDRLEGNETISPGQMISIDLSQGYYHVSLQDCDQSILLERYYLPVTDQYDLRFTGPDLCNSLYQAGVGFNHQSRYDKALEPFQSALACYQETGDWYGEGQALNGIGDVHRFQGRFGEGLTAYEQSLAIFREVGDRAGEGRIINNIGLIHHYQGRYREALDAYEQALTIDRELGDQAGEGITLNNMAGIYGDQGRYGEALETFEQVLNILREAGDRVAEGRTLSNIGVIYLKQGRYEEALVALEQALTIIREEGDRISEGAILHGIGTAHQSQGRYGEALENFAQALSIRRQVGDRAGEGITLNNIGAVYRAQGRDGEALAFYERALEIFREVGSRAGEDVILHNIGRIYDDQGRYEEALAFYEQALAISRETGDHAAEGITLNSLGLGHHSQGHYEESQTAYEQALIILREVGDRANEAATLNNIGLLYEAQGRYGEALAFYEQALVISREVGAPTGEGSIRHNIGRTWQALGEDDVALDWYQQAIDIRETIRTTAGSEQGRTSFIAQYAGLYVHMIALLHQQVRYEEAFLVSEQGRARTFLDSLATGHVQLSDDEGTDLWNREQEAYAARQAAQDALTHANTLDLPDAELVTKLEAQLAAAEEEYAAALDAIDERGERLKELIPGRSTVLGVKEVQAELDEQTTLLSYWVTEDQTLAFLVTHDSFHTIALDVGREDLSTTIADFRSFPNLGVTHPESAVTLHGWLIEPLWEHLTTPHLAIVPHSVLHYLPFAASTDGERFLLDDYVITYLPSASALPFIQDNIGEEVGTPLILGNPDTGDLNLDPLTFAEQEAQAIADLYDVQPLLAEAATESSLREQVTQASLVHLAAHGEYNPYNPLYSAIALAPDGENDGLLEVHEVYGLNLTNTDLVVLSACETQLGELSAGDEIVGLSRAFIYAGTPSVIATLWNVNDESTRFLMERFYGYLQTGYGKGAALRQAQLDTMAEYPNPYYWAAFTLTGDTGEVETLSVVSRKWIWLGGGVLFGGFLFVLISGVVRIRRRGNQRNARRVWIALYMSNQRQGRKSAVQTKCLRCGSPAQPGEGYCSNCGGTLCSECCFPIEIDDSRCRNCGAKMIFLCTNPHCGKKLRSNKARCPHCKEDMRPECPSCGGAIDSDRGFCRKCGQAICPECFWPVGDSDPHCQRCGAEFFFSCPQCSTEVPADVTICPKCGTELE